MNDRPEEPPADAGPHQSTTRRSPDRGEHLLSQLVAHLREHRTRLQEEWSQRIQQAHLLTAMTPQEMAAETTSVYDNYVEVLETGNVEALQHYASDLSERIIPRGVETHEVVGIVLLLRDVLARSLFEKYQRDFSMLNEVLDAYEPAANRIANTVAVSFVDERERVIRQQQDAIRELSTPVLPVRERLLILPIIGVLDSERARQLTEQLLSGIRKHRAKVVVIDITGSPDVDEAVANHLVQTVDASRLMGASVIITGLSPKIAQTLVTIGVDLSKMNTIGDLQGGLEEAERLLGYTVTRKEVGTELVNGGPALVSIMRQGSTLIASVHTALDDSELVRFEHDLVNQIGEHRSRGVIIDVAALDVIDSFAALTLRRIAEMARLRGALTVLVGIQPEVAFTMVRLGMGTGQVPTALDLEEGLQLLAAVAATRSSRLVCGRPTRNTHVTAPSSGAARPSTTSPRTTARRCGASCPAATRPPGSRPTSWGGDAFTGGHQPARRLTRIHHDVAIEVLRETASGRSSRTSPSGRGELLLEVLAAYDMSHRSVLEPRARTTGRLDAPIA